MKKVSIFCVALSFFCLVNNALALSVEVKGVFKGGAILTIDGKQRAIRAGKASPEGVKVVSSDAGGATLEIDGKQQYVAMSRTISTNYAEAEKAEVRIQTGPGGHFVTPGRINGIGVQFLVDTGATTIAMNLPTAQRLGINYRSGQQISLTTANGDASAYLVTLDRVSIGSVEVQKVEATVSMGDFPKEILLGNSYLSRVEMRRENGVLILQSRF